MRTRVPKAFTKPGLTAERQYKIKLRTKWKKNVVSQKKERLDRIDEAFLHERSIDRQTYERQRDQLREQLALVEIELNDAVLDQLDIDGVLAFAEHVVTNARAFGSNSISLRNSGSSTPCFLKGCALTERNLEPPQPAWLSRSWTEAAGQIQGFVPNGNRTLLSVRPSGAS